MAQTSGQPNKGKVQIVLGQHHETFPSDMSLNPSYLAAKFNCKAQDILGLKTDDGVSLLLSYANLAREIDGKVCKLELRSVLAQTASPNDGDDDKEGDILHNSSLQIKAGTAKLMYFYSVGDSGNGAAAQLKQWAIANPNMFIQRIWTEQFNRTAASNAYYYWYYVLYTACKCEHGNGWNLSASDVNIKLCYSSHDGGKAALEQYHKFTQENANVFIQNIWTDQFNQDSSGTYHYFYRVVYSQQINGNGWNLVAKDANMRYWHSVNDSAEATKNAMNTWLAENSQATVHKMWTQQFNRSQKGAPFCYWTYVVYT